MNSWEHRWNVEVYPTNGRAGIPGLLPTKLAVEAFSDRDRKVPIPARQTEVTR